MKDKGTQTKCTLCKQQYKVFSDPEKHTDRSFCEKCLERVDFLTGEITLNSPCCSVEIWSGAILVVSFTGGPLQDGWVEWPGINGSPGIPRQNIPFRPWVIVGKFPLRDFTDDEVTTSIWYWLVEKVELREAWDRQLERLKKERDALEKKLTPNEDGEVPVDQGVRNDLEEVKHRIKIGEYRQMFCPEPGEDTVLFRRLVGFNRRIEFLQLNCEHTDEDEIRRLQHEAAEIMGERCDRQLAKSRLLSDEAREEALEVLHPSGVKESKLYLVAFKGYAYVMANSEEEAIERGLQTAETNGCRPWATKATGCFPEFEKKEPVDSDGRTCAEVLRSEGFK